MFGPKLKSPPIWLKLLIDRPSRKRWRHFYTHDGGKKNIYKVFFYEGSERERKLPLVINWKWCSNENNNKSKSLFFSSFGGRRTMVGGYFKNREKISLFDLWFSTIRLESDDFLYIFIFHFSSHALFSLFFLLPVCTAWWWHHWRSCVNGALAERNISCGSVAVTLECALRQRCPTHNLYRCSRESQTAQKLLIRNRHRKWMNWLCRRQQIQQRSKLKLENAK